ncbi:RadC-like JAB domain [Candidatus Hepatincola sp. Av]
MKNNKEQNKNLLNQGHRKRVKTKFLKNYHNNLDLSEDELLELILFYSLPRRDVKDLAKKLIRQFGSIARILNTESDILKNVEGLSENTITLLYLIKHTAAHLLRKKITNRPILNTWSTVLDYCYVQLAYKKKEYLKILYLNNKYVLIKDDIIQEGSINQVVVDAREIVKTALNFGAVAFILVHNHPSGDDTPSKADIELTKSLAYTCKNLNITLYDHIIIGQEGITSFRESGLL